ncbi:hypothetical protein [Nitrosomonas sp. ANs5]|uniref:hypothetical protein n=1 Tax=Nitrosomonas sp. ANs5 TaxID=3423941 RepID=UPI003D3495A5
MSQKVVIRSFLETLATARNAGNSLTLAISNDQAIDFRSANKVVEGFDLPSSTEPDETYNFVVVDLPLGMGRRKARIGDSFLSIRDNGV